MAIGDDNDPDQIKRVEFFNAFIGNIQKYPKVKVNGLGLVRVKGSLAQILTDTEDHFREAREVQLERKKLDAKTAKKEGVTINHYILTVLSLH